MLRRKADDHRSLNESLRSWLSLAWPSCTIALRLFWRWWGSSAAAGGRLVGVLPILSLTVSALMFDWGRDGKPLNCVSARVWGESGARRGWAVDWPVRCWRVRCLSCPGTFFFFFVLFCFQSRRKERLFFDFVSPVMCFTASSVLWPCSFIHVFPSPVHVWRIFYFQF